jgi:DMSO/TMAO reductase YedYZ molybdopterin-dependent catalytic subunit
MKNNFFERTETISNSLFLQRSVIAFVTFAVLITVSVFAWKKLLQQPKEQGALAPLRATMNANEKLFGTLLREDDLSKTFPADKASKRPRVNGALGLRTAVDSNWKLSILVGTGDTLSISLEELKSLPKKDIVFDFKCIEGWSQVTHWAGVSFSDFVKHYKLTAQSKMKYVGLLTPDKGYYVGIDMKSALHPQTILCYEMNGKPLPLNQGYPLRLIIPVKYGIKHLKRIGTIFFSNEKPADYWAERGYDYYSGL